MYFGFQTVGADKWIAYAWNIQSGLWGLVSVIVRCKVRDNLSREQCRDMMDRMTISESEKQEVIDYLYDNPRGMTKEVSTALQDVANGTAGVKDQNAFAWISSTPITNYETFGVMGDDTGNPCETTSARWIDCFRSNRNIVASVGAWVEPDMLSVRGIFRPPHQVLYGHHRGISLMLHGFAAHVAYGQLGLQVYRISDPVDSMIRILRAHFVDQKPFRGVAGDVAHMVSVDDLGEQFRVPLSVYLWTSDLQKLYTDTQ